MSETAYTIWGDVQIVTDAVYEAIRNAEWSSTGGTDGCAQCSPVKGDSMTFQQRVERGHLRCAYELARTEGAQGIRQSLICGSLNAAVRRALDDPRFGYRDTP